MSARHAIEAHHFSVTTRTTNLTSVHHETFNLRFSNYRDTCAACNEEPASRASRIMDWLDARISGKASQWMQELHCLQLDTSLQMPWWKDLKDCVEFDTVPNPYEAWNHPVAGMLSSHFEY